MFHIPLISPWANFWLNIVIIESTLPSVREDKLNLKKVLKTWKKVSKTWKGVSKTWKSLPKFKKGIQNLNGENMV